MKDNKLTAKVREITADICQKNGINVNIKDIGIIKSDGKVRLVLKGNNLDFLDRNNILKEKLERYLLEELKGFDFIRYIYGLKPMDTYIETDSIFKQ